MKYKCKVCGQIVEVAEGEPCPICGASHDKLVPVEEAPKAGELSWACEHEIGVAQGVVEITSRVNVLKLACIWQWPDKH